MELSNVPEDQKKWLIEELVMLVFVECGSIQGNFNEWSNSLSFPKNNNFFIIQNARGTYLRIVLK